MGFILFYKKLYVSPSLKKKKKMLIYKIKTGKIVPNLYVITLAKGDDLLEFYQSFQLKQPYFKEHMPYIVGLADGYEEAVKLVETILLDAYEKTGSYDIRKFCLS